MESLPKSKRLAPSTRGGERVHHCDLRQLRGGASRGELSTSRRDPGFDGNGD